MVRGGRGRGVRKKRGRFYLLTDVCVAHTEGHKRTRKLMLRQMFLHFNSQAGDLLMLFTSQTVI